MTLTQAPACPILLSKTLGNQATPLPQTLQLILFAVLAGVVLYQLYSVLGRRVGRQPEDAQAETIESGQATAPRTEPESEAIADGVVLSGLAAVRARDATFELGHFLSGAKGAYQMVVKAFAEGDRDSLKRLLAPSVYDGFEAAIAQREAENRTETVEFAQAPRADLESATMDGDRARLVVRFLAEFRARTKGPEGEGVDDRRTAELWTFERDVTSRDPNWVLVHVDAAEA
ncbi:MAG: TIM44-related membrane protein TimA [Caulobacter sp.]|nr:TIM44-related membrane protein TimA [Caulobacter sp.]